MCPKLKFIKMFFGTHSNTVYARFTFVDRTCICKSSFANKTQSTNLSLKERESKAVCVRMYGVVLERGVCGGSADAQTEPNDGPGTITAETQTRAHTHWTH